jgi:hypothetical protein
MYWASLLIAAKLQFMVVPDSVVFETAQPAGAPKQESCKTIWFALE